jgi:hypothetical protein
MVCIRNTIIKMETHVIFPQSVFICSACFSQQTVFFPSNNINRLVSVAKRSVYLWGLQVIFDEFSGAHSEHRL